MKKLLLVIATCLSTLLGCGGRSSPASDNQAPTLSSPQTLSYSENSLADVTLATVGGAVDNTGVTQFRFVYTDNTTVSATSEDGNFTIDSSGNIKLTNAGFTSTANNYEATPNTHVLKIQAGDAKGNWSSIATVTLNENDVVPAASFSIVAFFDNWASANDIFNVNLWTTIDPATTGNWFFYKNGQLIAGPTSYPIPYTGSTGQMAWNDTTTFTSGDTLQIVAVVNGVAYESNLFTCP